MKNNSFVGRPLRLLCLSVDDKAVRIDFCIDLPAGENIDSVILLLGKTEIFAKRERYESDHAEQGTNSFYFSVSFAPTLINEKVRASFLGISGSKEKTRFDLRTDKYFPVSDSIRYSSAFVSGLLFYLKDGSLVIKRAKLKDKKKKNKKMYRSLWKSGEMSKKKAVIALRLAALYKKLFVRKPIWLISDRFSKAGDNGEALYLHIQKSGFKGARCLFVINRCKDARRLKKQKFHLINPTSWKYKILFLCADKIISSGADEYITNPFVDYSEPYSDLLWTKKFVFLQHGVIKDDMSQWLNKYNKNIHAFVTSSPYEKRSIVDGNYAYLDSEVWLTGLARFDLLYHDEKNMITIMPTWRSYLMESLERDTGIWKEKDGFTESEYFKFYNRLINDTRLLDAAENHGYKICFMPHPNTITKIDLFDKNPSVTFLSFDDSYRDVYAHSNLILTDYSSAVFDFVYLDKPVVYTQFDKDEFFSGSHVYIKGYFDYERDGFGEVVYDYPSTVDVLIEYMENGCKFKDVYKKRKDDFFAFDDRKSSERILNKIMEM